MPVRGIRGATTVAVDRQEEVLAATSELLAQMQQLNAFVPGQIAAVFFTVTSDIHSAFPARAARTMGWDLVPLMCFREMEVEGSLPLCIRILILINTDLNQEQIKHVYLHGAKILRPDLRAE
jgi:chorismate mutase